MTSPSGPESLPGGGGKETILLADDEERMRTFLEILLAKGGYRVLAAADGESALSLAVSHAGPIHLLVTDVMMPNMNGKELADRLCALRSELKVLFVSGYNRADFWPNDTCEDDTDWLPKPFSGRRFLEKVRRLLDSMGRARGGA